MSTEMGDSAQTKADSTTTGHDEIHADDEPTVTELREEIQTLREEVEDTAQTARRAIKGQRELRKENRTLRDELAKESDARAELEQEVDSLRERTDLLQTVRRAGSMGVEERAAVCIQTLYNEAYGRGQKDTSDTASASMDYKKAEGALGGGVSRDQIYRTFGRAEDLVDDRDVVKYVKEDRSSAKNTRLVLTLKDGDVPATIAGHEIEEPEV